MQIPGLVEKKCPECGKIIFPTSQWTYKMKGENLKKNYYCSWKCFKVAKYG